jgi:hypothetical protein
MIATLIALVLVAGPPGEPKPPTADRTIAGPVPSPAARAEAARKKQERNRLRALNSRRLAGMEGPGPSPSRGPRPGGFGNFGGDSAGATGPGNPGSMNFGGDYGGFGGGWADTLMASPFEQQLASTFRQAQGAMAAGQAALEATASLS